MRAAAAIGRAPARDLRVLRLADRACGLRVLRDLVEGLVGSVYGVKAEDIMNDAEMTVFRTPTVRRDLQMVRDRDGRRRAHDQ